MRMRALSTLMLAYSVVHAAAETRPDQCLKINDQAKRLACFDTALNYSAPDVPAKDQPSPKPSVTFMLREKGDLNNFAGAEVVDKPAQLSLQNNEGTDASIAKFGVIAAFRPLNDLGWQPFASASWNRDTSGKTPKDVRDLSVGVTGPLWDAFDPGWTLFPTVRATHRYDQFGAADSNRLVLHVNVVKLAWVNSVPSATTNSYSFVPHFGLIADNRTGGGSDGGLWRSAYVGFEAAGDLNRIMPRLSASVSYEHFVDQDVPIDNSKRQEDYTTISLRYALTDPDDKSIAMRPFISLSREIGTDVLGGGSSANKLLLSLGLKYN